MNPSLNAAVPILASLDITKTIQFYQDVLGFTAVYQAPAEYGIVQRDAVQIHFWACSDQQIAENTSCRIGVTEIEALYAELQPRDVIHPHAPLGTKPWGTQEFSVIDLDGNLITFFEAIRRE